LDGFNVRRVVDRSHARVPEHAHDWPVISVFVMGGYLNETEIGTKFIAGPSVVFYNPGAAHRNTIAADGFEQIEIEFDATWLGRSFLPTMPVQHWIGAHATHLFRACGPRGSDMRLRTALRRFLRTASAGREPVAWIDGIAQRLRVDPSLRVKDLACAISRHPSWVGSAYRHATGEGVSATAARFRVERAGRLLRESELPCARIALEAGFYDQSHMNRTFQRVLGRSPTEVRADRLRFRTPLGTEHTAIVGP
jgi:AraC family transcriptional regulator